MVITGRVPLLLLLGLLPVVARPAVGTVWLWLLVVAVLVVVDLLLAPRPASLTVTRDPVGVVRLGHPAASVLRVANPGNAPGPRARARRVAALGRRDRQPAPGRPRPAATAPSSPRPCARAAAATSRRSA